jgi:methionine synthase II (cobalamin-independent)
MAFAIGTLPHADVQAALRVVLDHLPSCPHWPQLPARSFLEQMEFQFSGCIPGIVVDEVDRKLVVDQHGPGFLAGLESFYEQVMLAESGGSLDHFAVSEGYAPGLFALEATLWGGTAPAFVKGQCTGPFTLGLGLTTTDDRAIYYDETLRDVVIKAVALHARWQARRLSRIGANVIVAVDEPVLASFGSTAMITIDRQAVTSALGEVVTALHDEGALVSTHCCGNTDWAMIIDAGVDILSFDAFTLGAKMAIYAPDIGRLLDRGGYLAWGIVPSTDDVDSVTADSLAEALAEGREAMVDAGLDRDLVEERTLITPSCGTGPLTVDRAVRVYDLLVEVADLFNRR